MLERVKEAPEIPVQGTKPHCLHDWFVVIIREWQGKVPPVDPIARDYREFNLRSQVAVHMAMFSTKVHDEAKLMVAWINHPHKLFCAALLAVIILDRRISYDCNKQLLFCLFKFIVQPAWLG